VAAGVPRAWYGTPFNTPFNETLQTFGMSPQAANYTEAVLGWVSTGLAWKSLGAAPAIKTTSSVTRNVVMGAGTALDDVTTFVNKPLGLGSTGRTVPANLQEQLAMQQAISNPTVGRQLPVPMTDLRWSASDGWVKMSQNVNGVEIHYVRNTSTGAIDDFKFK
jgi:filamentous hemagglutinin